MRYPSAAVLAHDIDNYLKGEPLYAKFGSIDDATLANGFILGNYGI